MSKDSFTNLFSNMVWYFSLNFIYKLLIVTFFSTITTILIFLFNETIQLLTIFTNFEQITAKLVASILNFSEFLN